MNASLRVKWYFKNLWKMFLQPCQSIYWNILPDFIGASSSEKKTEKSWTALKDFLRTLSVFRRIWLQNHILQLLERYSFFYLYLKPREWGEKIHKFYRFLWILLGIVARFCLKYWKSLPAVLLILCQICRKGPPFVTVFIFMT